jgi:outer membrane lipoprotein carrier protein
MKRYLLLLWSLLSVVSISAQTLNEAQIRQRVNQAAAAMKTMHCDFVQTKHLKMLNDNMVAQGKMYYQQSSKLRWEYTNPYTYTFVLNSDKVLLKNQQRNDVIDVKQNKMFREIARVMMSSVVGNCLSDDKTFKTTISTTNSEWIATLVPQRKDMRQMFQKIVLHFNQQRAVVSCVEMVEKNGDKTVINLKNIRTNETINAAVFAVR